MIAKPTPVQTRAQDRIFVAQCSLEGLRDRLPLVWPTPPGTPPAPKKSYRSHYVYLGWQDLLHPAAWEQMSDFDLLLRLIDFSGLRPVLAQRLGWISARGQVPFDPVSTFLLIGWQITNTWNRAETLRNIGKERYADYARRFGYKNNLFPSEGGLRYFLTAFGQNSSNGETILLVDEEKRIEIAIQQLNHLLAQSMALIVEAGLLSPQAWNEALICPDGMIHESASRMRCSAVQESCYQSTALEKPRPCPAKEKGRQGCECDSTACAQVCRYATPRDRQARFVYYSGSNKHQSNPNRPSDAEQQKTKRGKGYYGYRSLPLILVDPLRRFSLILLDDFSSANRREHNPFAAQLLQLHTFYPDLKVKDVVGDAAFGYDIVLKTVYNKLHARRVIDLRSHDTDEDKDLWPVRGYDDKGRPICPFGYSLTANGFDFQRRRRKWACLHACRKEATPTVTIKDVIYPPDECPYQNTDDHPHGRIINVGERFSSDNSIRLVRDVLIGSQTWKRLYHRARNAAEGRNSTFQKWGLKRLPFYGQPRNTALIFLADVWANLTTLARLVREATAATGG